MTGKNMHSAVALYLLATAIGQASALSGLAVRKPGLYEVVPAGQPYTIKWDPDTTNNTLTISLIFGKYQAMQPIATIGASVPNSGSLSWTPATSLRASTDEDKLYGLHINVDGLTIEQYSDRFKISKPDPKTSSPSGPSGPTNSTGPAGGSTTSSTTPPGSPSSSSYPRKNGTEPATTSQPSQTPTQAPSSRSSPPASSTSSGAKQSGSAAAPSTIPINAGFTLAALAGVFGFML